MALVEVEVLREHYRPGVGTWEPQDHYFTYEGEARQLAAAYPAFVKIVGPAPRGGLPGQKVRIGDRRLVAMVGPYYFTNDGLRFKGAAEAGEALGIPPEEVKALAARTLTTTAKVAKLTAFDVPEVLEALDSEVLDEPGDDS